MRDFIKFMIYEDQFPVRWKNLPFALLVIVLTIIVLMFIGFLMASVLTDSETTLRTMFILGLWMLGLGNGFFSLTGMFVLALRTPDFKGDEDEDE